MLSPVRPLKLAIKDLMASESPDRALERVSYPTGTVNEQPPGTRTGSDAVRPLTVKDLQHLAQLSRLHLTDDDLSRFSKQLQGILQHFDKLEEADTKDVSLFDLPASQPNTAPHANNVFRDDTPQSSLSVPDALINASKERRHQFVVPKADNKPRE